ncbi:MULTISPECIES: hypothetical protein [unclassified Microcoleus]
MSSPNEPRIPAPLGQGVVKTKFNILWRMSQKLASNARQLIY